MPTKRTVVQQLPIVIVLPDAEAPGVLRCHDVTVTTYDNGDWAVANQTTGTQERGSADIFERSIAAFFLRMLPSPALVEFGSES